jgi:hypothetical protein
MNKIYLKYFLIIAATGIWGLIIYRVIRATHSEGSASIDISPVSVHRIPEVSVDTFTLYNDYPDPFVPANEEVDTVTEIRAADIKVANPPSDLTTQSDANVSNIIKFRGVVTNPQKKIKIAIVSINNKEFVVHERDNVEGVFIRKIKLEKLEINYKNKDFTIEKEH